MAGEYVSGIAPYNFGMMPFYNNYANAAALDSLYNYSGMSVPGMFSMDGSLFSGNIGGSYMPYWGGMNYEQYYKIWSNVRILCTIVNCAATKKPVR